MRSGLADGVWFAHRPDDWVLRGVSLEVPASGFLTILGPSGAGKTTLLKLLAGLLRPQHGHVEVLGCRTDRGVPPEVRHRIGYIPQQLGLVRGMTALENVLLGALGRTNRLRSLLGLFAAADVEAARRYLAQLGLERKAGEQVFRLSGGERQRVAIARTLLQRPRVVFADEFISDLDLPRAAMVLQAMADLVHEQHLAFVINLHDLPLIQEIGGDVLVLKHGTIVHRGRAADAGVDVLHDAIA